MLEALAALDIADPTAAVRKAVLLYLAHEGRMTVARAGQLLGLDREDSIRWYTSHGDPYPDVTPAELQQELDTVDGPLAQ